MEALKHVINNREMRRTNFLLLVGQAPFLLLLCPLLVVVRIRPCSLLCGISASLIFLLVILSENTNPLVKYLHTGQPNLLRRR